MVQSLLTLVALAVAAEPINPGDWLKNSDFPTVALRGGDRGAVFFALTVSPAGKVEHCEIMDSSGSNLLDARTCSLLKARGRFRPARDDEGKPVTGVFRSLANWVMPGVTNKRPSRIDLDVELSRLPPGMKSPVELTVSFLVDTEGRISSCRAERSKAAETLGEIACSQVHAQIKPEPARDAQGIPVRSVQCAVVAFIASNTS